MAASNLVRINVWTTFKPTLESLMVSIKLRNAGVNGTEWIYRRKSIRVEPRITPSLSFEGLGLFFL